MIFVEISPADVEGAELVRLHFSLNSPVVAIDALPTGSASAAIALHRGAAGGARPTVALRAAKTGQLVCYSAGEAPDGEGGSALAIEAALCFAEGLGFLFDDDEVERRGEAAAELWAEFVGREARKGAVRTAPRPERANPEPAEPAETARERGLAEGADAASGPDREAPAVGLSPQSPGRLLSRFRIRTEERPAGGPPAPPARP